MGFKKIKTIVSKLSKQEKSQFDSFLDSPFFNPHEKNKQLYHALLPYLNENSDKKPPLKEIAQSCGLRPDNSSLSVYMSKLLALVEEFLVQRELRRETATRKCLLMQGFAGIECQAMAYSYLSNEKTSPKKQSTKSLLDDFLLKNSHLQASQTVQNVKQISYTYDEVVRSLNTFYLSRILKAYCSKISAKNIYGLGEELDESNYLIDLSENLAAGQHPLSQLYGHAMLLVKDASENNFYKLSVILDKFHHKIERSDLSILYLIALNYCIRQTRSGKSNQDTLFIIISKMVENNALYEGRYLPADRMRNIVAIVCDLKKFDWCETFVKKHYHHVHPDFREDAYTFNMGAILFNQKRFEEAHEMLIKTEIKDLHYEISRRTILLKIFYELNEELALVNHAESYKAFIRKNKSFQKENKKSVINFINMTVGLYKSKHRYSKTSKEKFAKKINDQTAIFSKKWLLQKLDEIK